MYCMIESMKNTNVAAEMTVAATILQQLGGRKFIAMTGSKNFVGDTDFLQFSLSRNKSGANKMKIELTPMDTYTVTTYRVRLRGESVSCHELERYRKAKSTFHNVYAEDLQPLFTSITGLYTSL